MKLVLGIFLFVATLAGSSLTAVAQNKSERSIDTENFTIVAQLAQLTQEQLGLLIEAAINALGPNATEAQLLAAINGVIANNNASNEVALGALGLVRSDANPNSSIAVALNRALNTAIASQIANTGGGGFGGGGSGIGTGGPNTGGGGGGGGGSDYTTG